MELREIEVFLILAEELHFGRTAEKLATSQSRVSQLVRTFERRIGGPLFERTSRRVALTPLGARLRDRLAAAYAQLNAVIDDARSEAARAGEAGSDPVLRVGAAGATGGHRLAAAIEAFEARHPGVRVVVGEAALDDPYGQLRRGEVDLLVVRSPVPDDPDLAVGPVIDTDERLLAVPVGHPVAARGWAGVEDLAELGVFTLRSSPRHLTCPFVPLYTPSGRLIPRRHTFSSYPEMLDLVAAGRGAHPLAASLLRFHRHPGVAFVPIRDLPPAEVTLVRPAGARDPNVLDLVRAAGGADLTPPAAPTSPPTGTD
jgi:DNA-binding transcriptional LysR family regulator